MIPADFFLSESVIILNVGTAKKSYVSTRPPLTCTTDNRNSDFCRVAELHNKLLSKYFSRYMPREKFKFVPFKFHATENLEKPFGNSNLPRIGYLQRWAGWSLGVNFASSNLQTAHESPIMRQIRRCSRERDHQRCLGSSYTMDILQVAAEQEKQKSYKDLEKALQDQVSQF